MSQHVVHDGDQPPLAVNLALCLRGTDPGPHMVLYQPSSQPVTLHEWDCAKTIIYTAGNGGYLMIFD